MSKESFELDSGLPDDYEVLIERAEFGFRDKYRGGDVPLLVLYCASPGMETREELFTIGTGWEITAVGTSVEGRSKFLASSWVGRLIVRCNELDMPDFEGGDNGTVLDFIAERGTAQDAHIWVGLKFRMCREEVDFGEGIGLRRHIMPVECLGFVEDVSAHVAAKAAEEGADFADDGAEMDWDEKGEGKEEPLAEAKTEPTAEPEPEAEEADQVTLALLKPLAEAADNVVAFQTTAVSSYASNLSDEWLGRLMDAEKAEQVYKELRE